MSRRVAITIENSEYDYSILKGYLKKYDFESDWKPMVVNLPESVIERVKGYDAVLAGGDIFDSEVLEGISDTVKIIARFGTGYDKIDLKRATQLGIAVTNASGKMSEPVADMTVLMMLSIARRICCFDRKTKSGEWWQGYVGTQLEGKRVGLIGFGNIAQKVAKYLQGFSCMITTYDKYFNENAARELSVKFCSMEEIARTSDYISLHVPLTNETEFMIDKKFLSLMKPTAYIINTSRGAVIKEEDIIEALKEGKIAGAALDVFEKEPINPNNPLLKMDNVIITPHIASTTKEAFESVGFYAADSIIGFFEGKSLPNILNPDYSNVNNERSYPL